MANATIILVTAIMILVAVLAMYQYYKAEGIEGVRKCVYKWILEAEQYYEHGENAQKLAYVVHLARSALPAWLSPFITDATLKALINIWFKEIKRLLDYRG